VIVMAALRDEWRSRASSRPARTRQAGVSRRGALAETVAVTWNDALNLLLRWAHLIAGIAWIGSSFYFIWLDAHLEAPKAGAPDVEGELWMVHSGGFYQVEKFRVATETLPSPLYWFKWEAYTTWLSGFALLVVVYYAHAGSFLVERSVADLSTTEAVLSSVGGLAIAWLVYDGLCRLLGGRPWALALAVTGLLAFAAWASGELFAPQAAYVEVGAMIGTIMVGNVWMRILPAQQKMIDATQAGQTPTSRSATGRSAARSTTAHDVPCCSSCSATISRRSTALPRTRWCSCCSGMAPPPAT
jgi:uncharacterized membrane protein